MLQNGKTTENSTKNNTIRLFELPKADLRIALSHTSIPMTPRRFNRKYRNKLAKALQLDIKAYNKIQSFDKDQIPVVLEFFDINEQFIINKLNQIQK